MKPAALVETVMSEARRSGELAEIERLRSAIEAIKQATIEGRVCDDVAWFDAVTTLHDFCEQTLRPYSAA
jgi:hypothetical protein